MSDPLAPDSARDTEDSVQDSPTGGSRRFFIRRSIATTAAVAGTAMVAGQSSAEAQSIGGVAQLGQHYFEIQEHENNHVKFLTDILGPAAYPRPQFVNLSFNRYADFANLARTFENTGTKAYLGAAGIIKNTGVLAVAASIALMEARHAGWINSIFPGVPLSVNNESFESSMTPQQVAQAVAPFFADRSIPIALANAISTTPSDGNDIAIVRFALGLEMLEQEFYNLNVPRFFGRRR